MVETIDQSTRHLDIAGQATKLLARLNHRDLMTLPRKIVARAQAKQPSANHDGTHDTLLCARKP
jgi:hypothetical protein